MSLFSEDGAGAPLQWATGLGLPRLIHLQCNPLNGSPPGNDSIGLSVQYCALIGPMGESLSGLHCTALAYLLHHTLHSKRRAILRGPRLTAAPTATRAITLMPLAAALTMYEKIHTTFKSAATLS